MKYSDHLRKLFPTVKLQAEDILYLESFQVSYLESRVSNKKLATLLREYPFIHEHLVSKQSAMTDFFTNILNKYPTEQNEEFIERDIQEALWEIAELIVYNKYPEIYDTEINLDWKLEEIVNTEALRRTVVIDAGAGTGRLAFLTSPHAKTVYAVEPVTAFRQFIKDKAAKYNITNLYTVDGFLDTLPFPDNSADFIMTSNAIGWNLEAELKEIERVLKPQGQAIHLFRAFKSDTENPLHEQLIASPWNYTCVNFNNAEGLKLKYDKTNST